MLNRPVVLNNNTDVSDCSMQTLPSNSIPLAPTPSVADFKTHISASTIAGIAYGYWGVATQGMSIETGILAGGLMSVAGMLPDLDSDGGKPLREISMFAAAVTPIVMLNRFRDLGMSHESMALAAMLIYVVIRFGVFEFFKRFTVHRGMWHSLPAALIAGLGWYLVMPCLSNGERAYKAMAVTLGFIVHLTLDEIWALELGLGKIRAKKSFGTALKFFGGNATSNAFIYSLLFALIYVAWSDNEIASRLRQRAQYDLTRPWWMQQADEPTQPAENPNWNRLDFNWASTSKKQQR